MKALVISDKQEIIDELSSYLKKNQYDIIVYRWLIKALDNIEEIQPDIIILSASEYPRHWKTLASFVQSGIGGNSVRLYLYNPEPLSDEEKTKAQNLGVADYLESLAEEELRKIPGCEKVEKTTENEVSVEPVMENHFQIIITHPVTGKFIFGKAKGKENSDVYECQLSSNHNLDVNQYVKFASVYSKSEIKAFSCVVAQNISQDCINLKVRNYYEEEI